MIASEAMSDPSPHGQVSSYILVWAEERNGATKVKSQTNRRLKNLMDLTGRLDLDRGVVRWDCYRYQNGLMKHVASRP
jgi:hypothetical protein